MTATATPQSEADVEDFGAALESDEGVIDVDHLSEEDIWGLLKYRTTETSEDELAAAIGRLAAGYAAVVDRDWRPDVVEVTISDADGSTIGFWRIETDWAVRHNEGGLSREEYIQRILETLEANQ